MTLDEEDYYGQDRVCSMTPTEFEEYCLKIIRGYAETEGLKNFSISHNVKLPASDGVYQIDVFATYTALGADMKVICECKKYKNKINREKVVILADKVQSLGAQKGILLSTSGFQSGAIQYAKEHGIALIQVFDRSCEFLSHSSGNAEISEDDPFTYAERNFPPYRAINYSVDGEPQVIYPPRSMVDNIYREMNRLVKERLGIDIDFSVTQEANASHEQSIEFR